MRAEDLAAALAKHDIKSEIYPTEKDLYKWQSNLDGSSDFVVVFGGDGTFLSTARQVLPYEIPMMGINHGHLGFLSEYGDLSMEDLAEQLKNHDFSVEKRTVIAAHLPVYGKTFFAINDIAINRSAHSNLLYTDLYIDESILHSFRADGIVISTPTGSTAYAMSAGGAVMDPNIRAFEIVPIAAHSLASRPHVISDKQTIVLQSRDHIEFTMQADGQELITLEPGSTIVISKAKYNLHLAKLKRPGRSFYNILRDKFKWGSSIT